MQINQEARRGKGNGFNQEARKAGKRRGFNQEAKKAGKRRVQSGSKEAVKSRREKFSVVRSLYPRFLPGFLHS